ncbi:MAG: hypothetical protein IJR67_01620 [Acholeplasmatales bacterium]|nr:hypothetical protein [Acholeplasmatales bacterium]
MMPLSYNELILCKLQAKIFELSVETTNYSSPIFIRRFMLSNFAKSFDNKSYLNQSNNLEDAFEELDDEYGISNYGKTKYSKDEMFWIGYIYRAIAIRFNFSSKFVFKLFPANIIINYYPIYHTFDIVEAAERMIEEKEVDLSSNQEKALKYMRKMILEEPGNNYNKAIKSKK